MPEEFRHSRITQIRCSRPMQALAKFDEVSSNGDIPVVIVPKFHTFGYFMMNIPSGVFVLHQKFLKRQGILPPGLVVFWPGWNRVSHIVTKASKTYNAPVRNCPTIDNVMVSVDVSVMFQIQDAEIFVYEMGATRFDEFLSAQTDEAIRGLVQAVKAMRVLDLREEFATGMLQGLNEKVNPYGVTILNVKITNVMLPATLGATLERTTSFQTQMQQQEKAHQANMRVLFDDAERMLTTIRRSNERQVQDIVAKVQRALIEREGKVLDGNAQLEVAILDADADYRVSKKEAESQKENARNEGERIAVEIVEQERANANARKVEAGQKLASTKHACQAIIDEAKSKAESITVQANVEGNAAKSLLEERKFLIDKKRLVALEQMARSGRFVIGGAVGDQILRDISFNGQTQQANIQLEEFHK